MSASSAVSAQTAVPASSRALPARKLAVWLFLGSEILFFSALIFTYIVVRLTAPPIPEERAWPAPIEIQGIAEGIPGVIEGQREKLGGSATFSNLTFEHHGHEVVEPDGLMTLADGTQLTVKRVLNIPLTALNTFLLILSSVAVVLALSSIQHGNQKGLVRWLGVTLVLGTVFLGIQAYEYVVLASEGLWFNSIPPWLEASGRNVLFGTTFYAMTGFHGLHVFGGVVTLLIIFVKAVKGHYSAQNHEGVELFGLYWHFVDLVWIILFTIVYLI